MKKISTVLVGIIFVIAGVIIGLNSFGITDINICSSDCFLEKAHQIQMSDKFHGSKTSEFNSDLQSTHLLQIVLRHIQNISFYSLVSQFHQVLSSIPEA